MNETFCGYPGDREEALIAFLYDEPAGDGAERARFEAHLDACAQCGEELAALRGVQLQLGRWAPPEPSYLTNNRQVSLVSSHAGSAQSANLQSANPQSTNPQSANPQSTNPKSANPQSAVRNPQSAIRNPQSSWWREIPAWAQVAAALLFLGVSAGIANLDVKYDANGLSVRTGWMKPPAAAVAPTPAATIDAAPWRSDLASLERQLKSEMRAAQTAASATAAQAQPVRVSSSPDADIVRRVRALVEESEKRQQNELALRVAEVLRDVRAQRQADLMKIDRTLGGVGVEVMKDRQRLNTLLVRTSGRQ
jgi:hypothetical protein